MTLPQLTPFTTSGIYTFPAGCNRIDVVLLGASGGGAAPGSFYTLEGYPGVPGSWTTQTLVLGVDIPLTTTTIAVTIGTGGAHGSGSSLTGVAGSAGTATTATATGMTSLSAAGGAGGGTSGTGTVSYQGPGPGSEVFNGETYPGGATQSTAGGAGNAPGGAGAGGTAFGGAGGVGARGEAWFYAYYVPPNSTASTAFFSMF
jgi:hypothetical protein